MKKSPIAIALATALSVGMSAPVFAESPQTTTDPAAQPQGGTAGTQMEMDSGTQMNTQEGAETGTSAQMEQGASADTGTMAYNPEDYDGKDVINAKGDKVGEVEKLVINTGDQQVYAVVGVGGFLGIGEKDVAIPLEQLQPQDNNLTLSSGITEDELKNSMSYNESEFSAFEPEKRGAPGEQPASTAEPIERDSSAPKQQY